jgi:hypothetical protein
MSEQQVVFQYLSAGSNTLTVPPGFSNQVLVYAWGAGGGAGYAGGGGGDTYQRTISTRSGLYTGYSGSGGIYSYSTSTQTITVSPGVIPPPGTSIGLTTVGPWVKISSGSPDSRAFGGGGGFVQGIVTVSSGDTVVISVGGAGGIGPRDGSGIGGIGDTPAISFNGGTTGVAAPYPGNDDQFYAAGGGGGGATTVLVNGIPMIVAAGGGGGGGGTSYQTGSAGLAGGVATSTSTTPRGGTSPSGYSVGGGGGAGYPFGGAGGQTFGDDAGAATGGYGGQNYANASVTSSTLTAGSGITPGGATNALYPKAKRGYAGYDGAVIVIFTKSFKAWIKDTDWKEVNNAWVKVPSSSTTTGGWKSITRAWVKADNTWKPIQSGVSLVPIPSTAEVVTINLTIAANANNYVLSDFLSATSYYPGRSIVNLTVNAGVIVGSGSVGTPALIIDGLVSGDLINVINNGNIAGAGGQGGAAGSFTTTTSGGGFYSKNYTVTTTSIPGRPGEIGGPALYVTYQTNLVNNGTIAGGGGGGGGGGGPTGGQGGGGAGRKAGSGANNGTLTAGGAGAGLGGQGGARGTAGSAGTNSTNAGGAGGQPGIAILGIDKVTISTEGTILGERKVESREVG